ncbi:cytochrome d ubiquinol oxidase subunit II [Effusibacillus dendaii]|nr:cytochrome d ubiquinol oxidase subunit II [Effusibacillus dendaii]
MRRLVRQMKTVRMMLAVTVGVGFVNGVLLIIQSYNLAQVVNYVFLKHARLNQIKPWLWLLFGLILIRGVFIWLNQAVSSHLAIRLVMFLFAVLSYYNTNLFSKVSIDPGAMPVLAAMTLLSVPFFIHTKRDGWAFFMTSLTIVFSSVTVFLHMFPRVMISSLNPDWSLTIYNAASGAYSLRVMTIITITVLPFVLLY